MKKDNSPCKLLEKGTACLDLEKGQWTCKRPVQTSLSERKKAPASFQGILILLISLLIFLILHIDFDGGKRLPKILIWKSKNKFKNIDFFVNQSALKFID